MPMSFVFHFFKKILSWLFANKEKNICFHLARKLFFYLRCGGKNYFLISQRRKLNFDDNFPCRKRYLDEYFMIFASKSKKQPCCFCAKKVRVNGKQAQILIFSHNESLWNERFKHHYKVGNSWKCYWVRQKFYQVFRNEQICKFKSCIFFPVIQKTEIVLAKSI